jgi:hypothetical protein
MAGFFAMVAGLTAKYSAYALISLVPNTASPGAHTYRNVIANVLDDP